MSTELAALQEELKAELATVRDTVRPPSGSNISTKGKVFTLPTGEESSGPLAAVILDWRSFNSYYKGVYNPQSPESPVCFAINKNISELAPSNNCPEAQAETCAQCEFDKFGSAATGRGKACKNTVRLAVVPANADEDTQPMMLNISPTGLTRWNNYVNKLAEQYGMLPLQVVTEISFTDDAYPSLAFSHAGGNEALETAMKLRASAQSMLDREPEPRS